MSVATGAISGGILKGPVIRMNKNNHTYYIALFEGERMVFRFSLNKKHPNYALALHQIKQAKEGDSLFFEINRQAERLHGCTDISNVTIQSQVKTDKKNKKSSQSGRVYPLFLKLLALICVLLLSYLSPIVFNQTIEQFFYGTFLLVIVYEIFNFQKGVYSEFS